MSHNSPCDLTCTLMWQRVQTQLNEPKGSWAIEKITFFVTFVYVVPFECHDNYEK
jgi:hypothetical protein